MYILIVFACIVVDVMCIVVVALQQPVWFIVLTMFKLALEFCWLKCWCCSGVQIEAGEEFADATGDVLQVTGVIISSWFFVIYTILEFSILIFLIFGDRSD